MKRERDEPSDEQGDRVDYSTWKFSELRAESKRRGYRGAKSKKLSISRLETADRNGILRSYVPPVSGRSIIRGLPVRGTLYRDPSLPFNGVPYEVIQNHLLPYLTWQDTWTLARTCRVFYLRMIPAALEKFKVVFRQRVKDKVKSYRNPDRTIDRWLRKVTPLAMACYRDLGEVTWDDDFKVESVISKERKIDYYKSSGYVEGLKLLCNRLEAYDSLDDYKAETLLHNARRRMLENEAMERRLLSFKNLLMERGLSFDFEFTYEKGRILALMNRTRNIYLPEMISSKPYAQIVNILKKRTLDDDISADIKDLDMNLVIKVLVHIGAAYPLRYSGDMFVS